MKIIPIAPGLDVAEIPQIDRFTDGVNIYIVETEKDYDALPQQIKDMRQK